MKYYGKNGDNGNHNNKNKNGDHGYNYDNNRIDDNKGDCMFTITEEIELGCRSVCDKKISLLLY